MAGNELWHAYGPSVIVPAAGFVEAAVLLWYGFTRRHRPIKALGWGVLFLTIATGVLMAMIRPPAVWAYGLWACAAAAAIVGGMSTRRRGFALAGFVLFGLAVAGYLPVSFAYVSAQPWTFGAMLAGAFCGGIVTILGIRDDESTAYTLGVGCMVSSAGLGVLSLLASNFPSHHMLVPFMGLCALGIIRGSWRAESRAIISSVFVAALVCAFYGSAFAPMVATSGWVYGVMGAGWVVGVVCGTICALRRERAGVIFAAGWVACATGLGVLWLDNGGLPPFWIIVPLQGLCLYAVAAGAGGKSDATLSCGIVSTLGATAAYAVLFWNAGLAHIGVYITAAAGMLLGSVFASPARASGRGVTRMLARATTGVSFAAGVVYATVSYLPFSVPAAPLFVIGAVAIFAGAARHETVAIGGGITWAAVATAGFWLAFLSTVSAHPITSASATANVALVMVLVAYRLWVNARHPAAVNVAGLFQPLVVGAAAAERGIWSAEDDPMIRAQRETIMRKTREAWDERKRTLDAVDPLWKEACLLRWVQEHRPSFWTCSPEWRTTVIDATCPICSKGFGLDPDSDEEDEEAPVFVCSNSQCRAVLHKQCFLQARGTMTLCPGVEGCPSTLEDGFKPVYRYPTDGGPSRYRPLPEIRARAKEVGIDGWEHLSRIELVREIQNREHHQPCFGTKPDACPDAECTWRTNCISALNVERFRKNRPVAGPIPLPSPGMKMGPIEDDVLEEQWRPAVGNGVASDRSPFATGPRIGLPPRKPLPSFSPLPSPAVASEQAARRPVPNLNATFFHSKLDLDDDAPAQKSETATPVNMPALRWPPRRE